MPRWLRRAFALLPAIGWYQSVPPRFWRNLAKLNGHYGASRFEPRLEYASAIFCLCLGSLMLGFLARPYLNDYSPDDDQWAGLVGVLALGLGVIYFCRRPGISYRLRDGTITALDSSGRTRWSGSLGNSPRLDCTWNVFGTYTTVRWHEQRRMIRVWDSLARALSQHEDGS